MSIKNVYRDVYAAAKARKTLTKAEVQNLSTAILSAEETNGSLLGKIARYAERIARERRKEWWQVRYVPFLSLFFSSPRQS